VLLAVVTFNACAVGAALDSVSVADGCAAVAAATTAAEVGAVAAATVAGCVEFDSFLAGVDVGCSGSGADVAGGVLGAVGSGTTTGTVGSLDGAGGSTPLVLVDELGSVVLVCAPPLLLTVTPGATWSVDDVALVVVVGPVLVDVEPVPVVAVDVEPVPLVDDVAADSVGDSPVDEAPAELVDDDSEEVPVVSAPATPYPVATAVTNHAATATPPYPPIFEALWATRRHGGGLAGAPDAGEANRGLTRGWVPVMGRLRCLGD
jgi:hypothetical protein